MPESDRPPRLVMEHGLDVMNSSTLSHQPPIGSPFHLPIATDRPHTARFLRNRVRLSQINSERRSSFPRGKGRERGSVIFSCRLLPSRGGRINRAASRFKDGMVARKCLFLLMAAGQASMCESAISEAGTGNIGPHFGSEQSIALDRSRKRRP